MAGARRGNVGGCEPANEQGTILQAWKAGPETLALRKQLEAMPDGGVYAITIPESPYRCPPGPYERACQVASYFKTAKPRSKVLILDANPDVQSKPALFKKVWAEQYAGIVEYRPQHKAVAVDAASRTVKIEVHDDVRADVLNVLPSMRAGAIATSRRRRPFAQWRDRAACRQAPPSSRGPAHGTGRARCGPTHWADGATQHAARV